MTTMISGGTTMWRWRRVVFGGTLVVLASGFTGQSAGPDAKVVDVDAPGTDGAAAGIAHAGEAEAAFVATEDAGEPTEPTAAGVQVAMVDTGSLSGTAIPLDLPEETFGTLAARAGTALPKQSTGLGRRVFPTHGTELAWHGIHDDVDGTLWGGNGRSSPASGRDRVLPTALHGFGFPSVERVERLPPERRRSWRRMVSWQASLDASGRHEPIPHVRCMGLSPAAVARRAARFEPLVVEYSIEHGVSASLVKALISVESCFDPTAVSPVGAIGLMQLMPATAAWLKAGDPRDVRNNLRAGIRYLASLRKRFGDDRLALAAYNAGPGNVRRYGGIPPFAETRAYVRKVLSHHRRYVAATALASR